MSSNLTPFVFNDALVRVHADQKGNPWFVAKDVCTILEITNHKDAISNLDDDEKGVANTDPLSVGGSQQARTISESGLYSLIFRSRKPQAKRFRKWVTGEVLPAIRKTGQYTASCQLSELPEMSEAAKRLKPLLKERVLASAIQAARLINATSQNEIDALYIHYCHLIAETPKLHGAMLPGLRLAPSTEEENIHRFINECFHPSPNARLWASDLYIIFSNWWCGQFTAAVPSSKVLYRVMQMYYSRRKNSNTFYIGVTVKDK